VEAVGDGGLVRVSREFRSAPLADSDMPAGYPCGTGRARGRQGASALAVSTDRRLAFDMSNKSDRTRGAQDAQQAFDLLRARWPKAFPAKSHEVRPLVTIAAELQEAFGWSPAYAKGVLSAWKARESYCRAVLAYPNRVGLDGSPTEAIVDDQARARAMAAARLEQIAAKKAKAAERRAEEAAYRAVAEAATPPPEPELEPEPAPPALVEAPAMPEPERPRARKLLTLGPAAKEALLKRGIGTTEVVATIQRRGR
jgi:sRNA-binding protein